MRNIVFPQAVVPVDAVGEERTGSTLESSNKGSNKITLFLEQGQKLRDRSACSSRMCRGTNHHLPAKAIWFASIWKRDKSREPPAEEDPCRES
jgi:hypothetical protein